MKQFKIRFSLKTHPGTMETIIPANTASDAKKMIESQYGSNIRSVQAVTEIR